MLIRSLTLFGVLNEPPDFLPRDLLHHRARRDEAVSGFLLIAAIRMTMNHDGAFERIDIGPVGDVVTHPLRRVFAGGQGGRQKGRYKSEWLGPSVVARHLWVGYRLQRQPIGMPAGFTFEFSEAQFCTRARH